MLKRHKNSTIKPLIIIFQNYKFFKFGQNIDCRKKSCTPRPQDPQLIK